MKYWSLFLLLIGFYSCSGIQKLTVNSIGSLVENGGAKEMETERNFSMLQVSIPPNLKFLEGMLYVHPKNEALLLALVKGYCAYAFGVNETFYLADKFQDKENSTHRAQAILNYSKSLRYGISLLAINDVDFNSLLGRLKVEGALHKYLDNHLDSDQMEMVFFSAQALGGLINLQRGNTDLIAALPLVKAMIDWSCKKDPDFKFGSCDIFNAIYESSRPKMLGGNPKKGEKIFKSVFKKFPTNILARVLYVETNLIPMMNDHLYKNQKKIILEKLGIFNNGSKWKFNEKHDLTKHHESSRVHSLNAIAEKRFEIIRRFEKDIF